LKVSGLKEDDVRVTTASSRLLRLPDASGHRCQLRRHLKIHGRRVKRWRHLDLGANRCVIECGLRRLLCPDCGVR
jgi:hypothetical protein